MMRIGVVLGMFLLLSACSVSPERADVYQSDEVGTAMGVEYAEVIALRSVKINMAQDNEEIGTVSGAVVGGVLGSGISSNSRASAVGAVLGAVVGGTVGKAVGRDADVTNGWEITYRLPSGETRIVIQPKTGLESLQVGQRIRIIHTPEGIRIAP